MRFPFSTYLITLLATAGTVILMPVASAQTVPRPAEQTGQITLQFPPGTPVTEVLEMYQQLTRKVLIRDAEVENKTVSVESGSPLTKDEAITLIEKTLLLADIALVPSGEKMLKVVNTQGSKKPAGEGVPTVLREADLPASDQVVSYVLTLQYLNADEAAKTFAQIIPPHPYGIVAALPNARALHITENSSTIKAYIELARQVDIPSDETQHKTIHLQRASAEEVTEQLSNLLGLDQQGSSSGSGQGSLPPRRPSEPITSAPIQPALNAQQAAAQRAAGVSVQAVTGGITMEAAPPIIQPINRTNSIIVVARPLDIRYIEALVQELDAESPTRGFVSRKLNYMDLRTFLEVAEKALLRHAAASQQNGTSGGLGGSTSVNTTQVGRNNGSGLNGFGNSRFGNNNSFGSGFDGSTGLDSMNSGVGSFGGSGGGFSSSGSGLSSGGSGTQLEVTTKAFSVLVANTLVIVDPATSNFFASGPPEQLRILNELADSLDVRPKQILLTTIIAELSLGNEFRFGLDWIRTIDNIGDNNLLGGVLQTQGSAYANPSALGGVEDMLPALDGLTVYGQIGKHLNVFLQTLETNDRFRVLQKPTVTTLNHQTATISIGQGIPYAGSTLTEASTINNGAALASTVQFIDATLNLEITPHIYNEREVLLEFRQQNRDVTSFTTISGNPVPNLSQQEMENKIIVPDRSTILLGGLISERDRDGKNGLPFLVRVPILKHLFGNTSKEKDRRELMIFIQPRILNDGVDHITEQTDIARDTTSYSEIQNFANPGGQPSLLPLPDWQEEKTRPETTRKAQAVDVDEKFAPVNR